MVPQKLVTNGDMSGNVTSSLLGIHDLSKVGLHLVWTGTPTGTFAVQASIDGADWVPLTLSATPAASGGPSSALLDLTGLCATQLRVVYTASSGTGTLNVTANTKGV